MTNPHLKDAIIDVLLQNIRNLKDDVFILEARVEFFERMVINRNEIITNLKSSNDSLILDLINLKTKRWWMFWK